ncbi:MAG: LptA/OstA family protein [Thermodesulfobacteriota bacterium]
MKPGRFMVLAGIWVLLLTWVPLAYGAAHKPAATEQEIPLRINADRLEADQKAGTIVFSGQVKALYGDSTLYSDKLLVYLKNQPATPKGAAKPSQEQTQASPLGDLGAGKIDRIVAKGQVRLVQADRLASGDEAIYYKDRDEVVLLGNPQLWQAENTLKGERIVFNLKTNRVLVESSPQRRVEALLYSKGTPGGKTHLPLDSKTPKERQP